MISMGSLKGLAGGARSYLGDLAGTASRIGLGRSIFQNRTALGAMAGGIYGGITDGGSVLQGAAMGAAAARYGGAGIRGAMRFRGSGMRAMAGGAVRAGRAMGMMDTRGAVIAGRRSAAMIGRTVTKGYNNFRTLGASGGMFNTLFR